MPRLSPSRSRERGMTLIEALVSLLLLSLVIVAFLGLLETTSRLTKAQTNMADSTENLRFSMAALVRMVRMAGTGGIPLVVDRAERQDPPAPVAGDPTWFAIYLDDNTARPSGMLEGGVVTVDGTDILRIHGALSGDLYEIEGDGSLDLTSNILSIPDRSPYGEALPQDLRAPQNPADLPLFIAIQSELLVSTNIGGVRHYNDYRIVNVADEPDAVQTPIPDPNPTVINYMTIKFNPHGRSEKNNPNGEWAPEEDGVAKPPAVAQVYAAGFLDEYSFFIARNAQGEPSLYRFAGSGYPDELVPNIVNLQVSLGCDINRDGDVDAAEWFFSKANPAAPNFHQLNALRDVRLSLVARTSAPELGWSDTTEMPENAAALSGSEASYRHKVITVRIGLRCHPPLEDT